MILNVISIRSVSLESHVGVAGVHKLDSTRESDRVRDLYLTGVRPNGKDIGVGAYGRVFEVEYCGNIFAAKEVHSILVQGVHCKNCVVRTVAVQ